MRAISSKTKCKYAAIQPTEHRIHTHIFHEESTMNLVLSSAIRNDTWSDGSRTFPFTKWNSLLAKKTSKAIIYIAKTMNLLFGDSDKIIARTFNSSSASSSKATQHKILDSRLYQLISHPLHHHNKENFLLLQYQVWFYSALL